MLPESSVIGGFISKVINDVVDISKHRIKEAVNNKNIKHQSLESQIYNIMVSVINKITYYQYEDDQDKIYDATEKILFNLKGGENDLRNNIKLGLGYIHECVDENKCADFIRLICWELSQDNYSELYREIRLLQQKMEGDKTSRIEQKVDVAIQKIDDIKNNSNGISSTQNKEEKFQNNKKKDYLKVWNSRVFLHIDNNENPLTLKDAFIMPDYKMYKSINRMRDSEKDTLDKIIDKFVNYDRTSTLLITGVPGIGKSTITSWMANKYIDDDRFIILRFRDWKKVVLSKTLLRAICKRLNCEEEDLENKVLILEGFDEMKALNIRDVLLNEFFNDIKDFDNFKCIITSRPAYINSSRFHNVLEIQKFNIDRIRVFTLKIKGTGIENVGEIESNLEVLGIPVILYIAIMSNVDISKNPTKPELYSRIFAEKGGIFDKFFDGENEYSSGSQIMRDPDNIKRYLEFLRKVAFEMFEKDELSLLEEECEIPKLRTDKESISILEFPIKHLFESRYNNIEFIHKSIFEYFLSEYIYIYT